jgi:hypothetical protein
MRIRFAFLSCYFGITLALLLVNHSVSWNLGYKESSRRKLLNRLVFSTSLTILTSRSQAFATIQDEKDLERLQKGYQRLNYLIENWEQETTICVTSNDNPYLGCDRTPMKVMEYLGFKNTEDPLFKADKVILRLQSLVSDDFQDEYLEAMDTWIGKYPLRQLKLKYSGYNSNALVRTRKKRRRKWNGLCVKLGRVKSRRRER